MKKKYYGFTEDKIIDFIKSINLFKNFNYEIIKKLIDHLEYVELSNGDRLFSQGDQGDAMYIVLRGMLQVVYTQENGKQLIVGEVKAAMPVGEMQLFTDRDYSATVIAIKDTKLVKISKTTFNTILSSAPEIIQDLSTIIRKRLLHNQLQIILTENFEDINFTALQNIEKRLEWVYLRKGQVLFHQGAKGDSLFIVVSGRLKAVIKEKDEAIPIKDEIGRGECIGEMSVLTGEKRTATVYAVRESYLVRLSKSPFEVLARKHPAIMKKIAQLLITRLRRATGSMPMKKYNINFAILPADPDVPLAQVSKHITRVLAKFGPALHLSYRYIDKRMGLAKIPRAFEDGPYSVRLTAWMDEQETKNKYIVYEADTTEVSWIRYCIRQADHILIVAQGNTSPKKCIIDEILSSDEQIVLRSKRTLLLLHNDGSRLPSGTSQWIKRYNIDCHFHIRMDTDADFDRLGRYLTGHAIGLVLSGGGARAFAHIGVIRALTECGIPIDMVGGTSAGAGIAAQYAQGYGYETMLSFINKAYNEMNPLQEYTLPIYSILKGRKYHANIKMTCGDELIENLWINYFCISSNLTTSEINIHRKGPIWKAIRASSSIPGLFAPVIEGDNLLVDGGILNNLPANIMKNLYRGFVIAVDVSTQKNLTIDYKEFPSPWKFLRSRISPFIKSINVPTLKDLLTQSTMLSSIHTTKVIKKDIDFYLKPPVDKYKMLDLKKYKEIVETGYHYAIDKIKKLKKLKIFKEFKI